MIVWGEQFRILCDHSGWDDTIALRVASEIWHKIRQDVNLRYLLMVQFIKDTGKWNDFLAYCRLIQSQIEGVK